MRLDFEFREIDGSGQGLLGRIDGWIGDDCGRIGDSVTDLAEGLQKDVVSSSDA